MAATNLLDRLSPEDRQMVVKSATRRRYRSGDSVFHAGDPGDSLHIIAKGRAAVQVLTPLGETATVVVLGPGQCFGELALIGEGVRTASVVAVEALETLALNRQEVDRLQATNVAVQRFMIEVLADQVARLTARLMEALFSSAELRVVRRLAEAVRVFSDSPDALVATVPVTQQELADMAGTTRPTVNRALQELQKAGIITLGRGKVEIHDLAALDRKAR